VRHVDEATPSSSRCWGCSTRCCAARVCDAIIAEERAMSDRIARSRNRLAELSLAAPGALAP